MKFHLMFILFLLSNLHNYEAEGIRLGRVVLSSSNHQAMITKSSSIEASNQDRDLITKTDELPSGINRKLITNVTSSNIPKNYKNDDGNKYDPKPDIKSSLGPVGNGDDFLFNLSPENWKLGEEGAEEQGPDNIHIGVMDYSAPKSKPPSHN
uniref:uncharacterized protein LOC122598517 n=1 Tax=Erigeron canadensis TaxID=72917 RepID=UPI001CB95418|nr:uncharacterized protein LOC122598517 [Erigeron canadensis]